MRIYAEQTREKNRDIFDEISRGMIERGFDESADKCHTKVKNLKTKNIEHLKQGLDLLRLRKALKAEPQLLAELLCMSTKKTTATIIDMMVCKFSAEGSSRKNVQKDVFDKLCSWMDDVDADTDLTLATLESLYHLVQKVLERHPHSTKSQFRRLFGLNHKTYEACLKKLANEANWSTVLKEAAVIRGRKCKLRTPPSKNWLRTEMYDSGTPDDLPVSAPEPSARETDLTMADLGHTDGSFLTTTTVHDIFRRNRTWREAFKVRDTSIEQRPEDKELFPGSRVFLSQSDLLVLVHKGKRTLFITSRRWSLSISQLHINELELRAAFFALQCFATPQKHNDVYLKLDNTTASVFCTHHCIQLVGINYDNIRRMERRLAAGKDEHDSHKSKVTN
ncbi:hypothetical protein Bbelb_051810 [Branchiostoma belcheri]|nr:hypothetical protein Bbelb_051810 [Branchiostoma belcheri]